jgi:hypothetical protein
VKKIVVAWKHDTACEAGTRGQRKLVEVANGDDDVWQCKHEAQAAKIRAVVGNCFESLQQIHDAATKITISHCTNTNNSGPAQ